MFLQILQRTTSHKQTFNSYFLYQVCLSEVLEKIQLHLHLNPSEMLCCKRKSYYVAAACIFAFTLMILYYLWTQGHSLLPNITPQEGNFCRGELASNTITAIKGTRAFIIAPYFDNRKSKITRVIGIVHHEKVKDLFCWFCCQPDGEIYVSTAAIEVHSDRFGFPYGAADLLCSEPQNCDPNFVSISWEPKGNIDQLPRFEIKNRKPETLPIEFTVCISPMFGNYSNVLQFIQAMEIYKILGAQKVIIYKNSCSQLMEKALEFYIAEGTIEIIPWPITSYLNVSSRWHFSMDSKDIGYYGQITALNDCVYRNMYKSKFVLLNDIDEIILPMKHPDWKIMMSGLQEQNRGAGIFLFESHVFPKTVYASTDIFNITSWNAVPGVNILQHIHREPNRKNVFNPKKMIVDPRKVVQTSVHSVLHAYADSVNVPIDVALVYHCREPLQVKLPRESLIRDTTIWRYNSSLIMNVNKVLQKTVF
ncbi:solute carrier family 2, facilitated glucose transporter member 8 isoform X6 [Chelonia mydas]|nr:solute carrier family 2, facilitated glucose transporter member 8 isoform X6 [Chelonia mydas]XP_037735454.1 solute carrier family 2, facilitated glucose transporter member 8 isoform X6 [Chelonia mydas]